MNCTTSYSLTRYWKPAAILLQGILVRIKEMNESIKIIEQLIDNIPDGDFQAKTKGGFEITQGEFIKSGNIARGELVLYYCNLDQAAPRLLDQILIPGFGNLSAFGSYGKDELDKIGRFGGDDGNAGILVIPDIDRSSELGKKNVGMVKVF